MLTARRVIFTVKDNKGNVVAQTVSPVIVITDDHKNAGPPVPQAPATSVTDGNAKQHSEIAPQQPQTPAPSQDIGQYPGFMVPNIQPTAQEMPPTYSRRYSQNGQDQHMSGLSNGHSNGHSNCHSNGLSSGYTSAHSNTSPSPTVRSSLSPGLHQTKRRKSSKVPANLAMTPSEPPQPHRPQNMSFAPRSQNGGIHQQWLNGSQGPMVQSDGLYYNNIGWGSNSGMDGSNGFGMSPGNMSHVAPKMFGGRSMVNSQSPGGFMHHQPIPLINRVVPGEGTCRGGIEITILGGHFVNGLTVMFGDVPATDTIFYSDTTLLCRLPPNPSPGAVIVSLKNVDSSYRPETVPVFTYIDDVEKELMALALTVVGMKMKGEMGSSKQIALSILRDSGMAAEAINSSQNNGGNQRTHLESTLLACLDFIDMDESPHPASLNHKNKSGQTMLHLACMLGMQKFAAALLARGVRADARDKNGWTPLHFAARCNRQDVVRRLLINGADAGLRTRGGETAADLGESDQIVRATRSVQIHSRQHSRSSSVSSETRYGRSRSGSAASITMPPKMRSLDGYYADGEYDDPESDSEEDRLGRHSRKPSMHDLQSAMRISRIHSMHDLPAAMKASLAEQAMDNSNSTDTTPASIAAGSPLSPPAMMAAWMEACREQLAHSFQNLQINIPAPGDYQTLFQNQMARLQNPMPKWNRPDASEGAADYKWSELLHPPVPPAYDDLYPEGKEFDRGLPEEKGEPVESAPNQTLDLKASTLALTINRSASPATSSTSIDLREIHRHFARGDSVLSKEQQAEYLAHIRKMKRIESDRRLFFFWVCPVPHMMLGCC